VGQATQAEVLKAQTQLSRMTEELLRMERERPVMEAELLRLLGRRGKRRDPICTRSCRDKGRGGVSASKRCRRAGGCASRPQLQGPCQLSMNRAQARKTLELARKESPPDFDLRLFLPVRRKETCTGRAAGDVVSLRGE